jgi:hypothetical protein
MDGLIFGETTAVNGGWTVAVSYGAGLLSILPLANPPVVEEISNWCDDRGIEVFVADWRHLGFPTETDAMMFVLASR